MPDDPIDYDSLWRAVTRQFTLGDDSIHGPAHWRRVEEIGLKLAAVSGADATIVRLFSVFHDSCRWDDGYDPEHGHRGASLAAALAQTSFSLDAPRLALLVEACTFHADGFVSAYATIGTCWDADRLDLPRVGVTPVAHMLSTSIAKSRETIQWSLAMKRR